MGPDMVILVEPWIDDSLGLAGGAKPFSVERLSAKSSIKALVIAVVPG
jgi:hypothetical protein